MLNKNDLTFEEYSKILNEEPTIKSAKEVLIRYLPERAKIESFCGNCSSRFISTDADWYKVITGREARNYWQLRYANMMLNHLNGFALRNLYRSGLNRW